MSLILEALKKSEADRQLGRAPGLSTPMPMRSPPADSRRASLAAAAVVALLLVGGAAWWLWVKPEARTSEAMIAPVAAPASGRDEREVETAPTAKEASRVPALRQVTLPEADMAAAHRSSPEFASTERESLPIAAAPRAEDPSAPVPTASTPDMPADPAPATRAPSADAAPSPDEPALPRLDQLGGPQREALPPLKQTMHVYAEQPGDRFVLIDGHRYREGDRINSELQLAEIRRDGTVFVFDGLRFLLPRP